MEISGFQWDEDNVTHIARHHVYPDEVEELAFDDEPWIRKGSGGRDCETTRFQDGSSRKKVLAEAFYR